MCAKFRFSIFSRCDDIAAEVKGGQLYAPPPSGWRVARRPSGCRVKGISRHVVNLGIPRHVVKGIYVACCRFFRSGADGHGQRAERHFQRAVHVQLCTSSPDDPAMRFANECAADDGAAATAASLTWTNDGGRYKKFMFNLPERSIVC